MLSHVLMFTHIPFFFFCRAPEEQLEAFGLLQLRYPSAYARLMPPHLTGHVEQGSGSHPSTPRRSSSRASPSRPSPSRLAAPSSTPRSASRGRIPHPQVASHHHCQQQQHASRQPPPPPPPGRGPHTQPQMPPWSPASRAAEASLPGVSELRPAPLDERIARLYYGRRPDGRPLSSPSKPRGHTPTSRNERRLRELHDARTISSVIRSAEAEGQGIGGASLLRDGTANAASTNAFASGLRAYEMDEQIATYPTAELLVSDARSPASRAFRTSQQSMASAHSGDYGEASDANARSPSSLSRPGSVGAISVGSHESPPANVAFGSGRPQRPEATTYTASTSVPAIGNEGEVMGVF